MTGPSGWVWKLIELGIGLCVAALLLGWAWSRLQSFLWLFLVAGACWLVLRVRSRSRERW